MQGGAEGVRMGRRAADGERNGRWRRLIVSGLRDLLLFFSECMAFVAFFCILVQTKCSVYGTV